MRSKPFSNAPVSPVWNHPSFRTSADASGMFYGLRQENDVYDMACAVMEGVAFMLRKNCDHIRSKGTEIKYIIATGGGAVTQSQNYDALKQNSVIFFIDRPTELLPTDGRPLSQSSGVSALYEARLPLYISFSDIRIKNISSPEETVHEIISKFNLFNF